MIAKKVSWLPSLHSQQYLSPGRLPDVLALIQILAFDPHTYRSENGLIREIQRHPSSASTWTEIAKAHLEFFRVHEDEDGWKTSLISRHVTPKEERGNMPVEFIHKLLETAVNLHDRQIRLAERWTYLIPVWVAIIAGLFSVIVKIMGPPS